MVQLLDYIYVSVLGIVTFDLFAEAGQNFSLLRDSMLNSLSFSASVLNKGSELPAGIGGAKHFEFEMYFSETSKRTDDAVKIDGVTFTGIDSPDRSKALAQREVLIFNDATAELNFDSNTCIGKLK